MTDLELEKLLRSARRVAPRPEIKERLRASVLSAAAVGGALATGTAHAAGAAAASTSASASATVVAAKTPLLLSALYALAAGAAVGGLVTVSLALRAPVTVSSSPTSRQTELRNSSAPSNPGAVSRALDSDMPPAPTASSLSEPKPPSASSRAAPSSWVVPSIERETHLLSEAQRALQRGDARGALGWLERYSAEFPRGALAEEALAARGVAWCSLGRKELGERALHTFEQTYPSSPLLPRLKAACRNLETP